jgi:multiple sugar transport system permease protein
MNHKNNILKMTLFYTCASILGFAISIPFIWMIITSLKDRGNVLTVPIEWIPNPVSFQSYKDVFTLFPFGNAILNSLFISVCTTLITVFCAAMAAYAFSKIQFKGRDRLFGIYLATMMIPGQVTIIPLFIILNQFGLINSYAGLLAPTIFNAFAIFMLRQQMKSVSNDYIDAGIIDGASHFRIFSTVILPLISPIVATLVVITFMGAWNDFFWPLVILTDTKKMTLSLALNKINGQYPSFYNILMAGSLLSMLPILVIYASAQKYFKSGLQIGGIKG